MLNNSVTAVLGQKWEFFPCILVFRQQYNKRASHAEGLIHHPIILGEAFGELQTCKPVQ